MCLCIKCAFVANFEEFENDCVCSIASSGNLEGLYIERTTCACGWASLK